MLFCSKKIDQKPSHSLFSEVSKEVDNRKRSCSALSSASTPSTSSTSSTLSTSSTSSTRGPKQKEPFFCGIFKFCANLNSPGEEETLHTSSLQSFIDKKFSLALPNESRQLDVLDREEQVILNVCDELLESFRYKLAYEKKTFLSYKEQKVIQKLKFLISKEVTESANKEVKRKVNEIEKFYKDEFVQDSRETFKDLSKLTKDSIEMQFRFPDTKTSPSFEIYMLQLEKKVTQMNESGSLTEDNMNEFRRIEDSYNKLTSYLVPCRLYSDLVRIFDFYSHPTSSLVREIKYENRKGDNYLLTFKRETDHPDEVKVDIKKIKSEVRLSTLVFKKDYPDIYIEDTRAPRGTLKFNSEDFSGVFFELLIVKSK